MKPALSVLTFIALAVPASAADTYFSTTTPAQREVSAPGQLMTMDKHFVEFTDGSFGIDVMLGGRTGRFAPAHHSTTFRLAQGKLHRAGNALIWSIKGRDIVVATHDWYYQPAWYTQPNVEILLGFRETYPGSESYLISASLRAN